MRRCPRCTFPFDVVEHHGVELDHCRRCGGTFLDPGEETEIFGVFTSPDVWKHSSVAQALGPRTLKCPEDNRHFFAYAIEFGNQSVEVDLCQHCAGIWLDAKEGKKLRDIVMEAGQSKASDVSGLADQPGVISYIFQLLSGLPMEVWNPRHRYPRLTISLIIILYVIFGLQIFVDTIGGIRMIDAFALVPAEILSGRRLWALITSAFLHGGLAHILLNTYFLYVFGDNVEDFLGNQRFLFVYFASAVSGSILQIAFQPDPMIPSIGASGAIAGLMGAYPVLFPHTKLYQVLFYIRFRLGVIWYVGLWVGFNVMMALAGRQGVAWMAHIGGFAAGALIALRYRVKPLVEQLQR